MKSLPWSARLYVVCVTLAGGILFAIRLPQVEVQRPVVFVMLIALSLAAASLKVHLPLPHGDSTMSLSYGVAFASLLLLGPDPTMVVAAAGVFLQCELQTQNRKLIHRTLFSMASVALTVEAAGIALLRFDGFLQPNSEALLFVLLLLTAATIYFLMNTGLVATAIALTSGERVLDVWRRDFLWSAPGYFISAVVAAIAARFIGDAGFWLVPVALVPVYLTYRTYKTYMGRIETQQRKVKEVADLHLATVEALARAIDARDQASSTHLQRMQLYATRLARAAGMSEPEIQAIKAAALLHDIGKLAVPGHILSKPGPLTEEEFKRVRIHSQVGADIIADVRFPSPVVPSILSHHERWDGQGYPEGLRGEQIPLGARILAIVDFFEAVTAERPYHRASTVDEAVTMLKDEIGRAFDPNLVTAFLKMLPSLLEEDLVARATEPAPASRSFSSSTRSNVAVGSAPDAPHNVYDYIAVAHREIDALYEIAQAMSTGLGVAETMEIISSKLTKVVPWSGCALYLYDHPTQSLKCGFASGGDAGALLHASISIDSSLCGWVARNRRTLVNANPLIAFQAAGLDRTSLKSAIVCPLVSNDALIGVLALFHSEAERYSEEHRRLLERVADQAGTVLHNAIVFDKAQEDALTDALTGLPNRRSMTAHFSRELARAERSKSEFALVVIDIDGFKGINDTYGHTVGDWALNEAATTLSGQLRPYNLCGRYAGDEFVLLLDNCSRKAAEARRRELQQRIGEVELRIGRDQALRLGVSAGVAVYPEDGVTWDELIAVADRRMYRDKTRRASAVQTQTGAATPVGRTDEPADLAALGGRTAN